MRVRLFTLAGAAILWFGSPAFAGACADDIHRVELAISARLEAAAASGKGAPQSVGAQLHRQPTLGSVADAEAKVGDIPEKDVEALRQFIRQAHEADDGGDMATCRKALADARRVLGP